MKSGPADGFHMCFSVSNVICDALNSRKLENIGRYWVRVSDRNWSNSNSIPKTEIECAFGQRRKEVETQYEFIIIQIAWASATVHGPLYIENMALFIDSIHHLSILLFTFISNDWRVSFMWVFLLCQYSTFEWLIHQWLGYLTKIELLIQYKSRMCEGLSTVLFSSAFNTVTFGAVNNDYRMKEMSTNRNRRMQPTKIGLGWALSKFGKGFFRSLFWFMHFLPKGRRSTDFFCWL